MMMTIGMMAAPRCGPRGLQRRRGLLHLGGVTAVLACACLSLTIVMGCGSRAAGKKDTTPRTSSGTVTTERMGGDGSDNGAADGTARMNNREPMGPGARSPGAGGARGSGSKSDKAKSGDADRKATSAQNKSGKRDKAPDGTIDSDTAAKAKAARSYEPPNLDLTATEQRQRVAAHLTRARAALRGQNRDPDRALSEARAALAVDAANLDAAVIMAHAYHAKRLYDTAEVILDLLYKERHEAQRHSDIHYVYGLVYDRTKRPEMAFSAYYKAVELKPDAPSALINLGVHYLRKDMFAYAIQVYERLSGPLKVRTAAVWTNLGSAYRGHASDYPAESGQRSTFLRQAETAYRRATSVDRRYANAYYNLGLLYLDAETFPGDPGDGSIAVLDTLERLERAQTYFEEYRRMKGADIDAVEARLKQVQKRIKREVKRRNRAADDDW